MKRDSGKTSQEVIDQIRETREELRKAKDAVTFKPTLAKRLDNWLRILFSSRRLCYIYFYYEEKGVDLKKPMRKMEPYLAWLFLNENIKNVTPLFETKIKKGRAIVLKDIKIIPIPYIEVI